MNAGKADKGDNGIIKIMRKYKSATCEIHKKPIHQYVSSLKHLFTPVIESYVILGTGYSDSNHCKFEVYLNHTIIAPENLVLIIFYHHRATTGEK